MEIPDGLKIHRLPPRERVIVFAALILFWLVGAQAILAIDEIRPSWMDGTSFPSTMR